MSLLRCIIKLLRDAKWRRISLRANLNWNLVCKSKKLKFNVRKLCNETFLMLRKIRRRGNVDWIYNGHLTFLSLVKRCCRNFKITDVHYRLNFSQSTNIQWDSVLWSVRPCDVYTIIRTLIINVKCLWGLFHHPELTPNSSSVLQGWLNAQMLSLGATRSFRLTKSKYANLNFLWNINLLLQEFRKNAFIIKFLFGKWQPSLLLEI